jgi:hypothetical protein
MGWHVKFWVPKSLADTGVGRINQTQLRGVIEQHFPYPVLLDLPRSIATTDTTNGKVWAWEGEINRWLEQHVQSFGGQRMWYNPETFIREPLEVDTEWLWSLISGDLYGFQRAEHAVLFKLTWA